MKHIPLKRIPAPQGDWCSFFECQGDFKNGVAWKAVDDGLGSVYCTPQCAHDEYELDRQMLDAGEGLV